MEIMILLVPMTLAITAAAVGFLLWAIDSGQYDDAERDGDDALFSDKSDSDGS
jgi:cbb3-type cytochrome oxidase maturation protein